MKTGRLRILRKRTVQSPIGRRILGAFALILLLITANGALNYWMFGTITAAKLQERRIRQEKALLDHTSVVLETQIGIYYGAVWAEGTLPNNYSSQRDPYTGAITDDLDALAQLDPTLLTPQGPLHPFVLNYSRLQDVIHTLTASLVRGEARETQKALWRTNAAVIDTTPTLLNSYRDRVAADLNRLTQDQDAAGQTAVTASVLVAVFSLALAVGLALALTRGIVQPVSQLKGTLQRVAEGDLSPGPAAHSRDEIGDVLTTLNRTLDRLRSLLSTIQQQAGTISGVSGELQQQAQTVGTRTAEEASAIQETLYTIDELSETARRIAASAADVAESTAQVQLAVSDSRRVMQGTTEEMQQVRARVQAISAGILALADRMQAIEEVLRFMAEIATETHLLALNATIEAAGAGPYGTRFSIIAGQVQELATQANSASEQITTLVESIRDAMQQTVDIGHAGVAEVDQGVEMVQDLERVHTRIESLVNRTRDLAFAISVATQQQRDGSKQIAQTVSILAQTAHTSEAESRQALATATDLKAVAQCLREAAAQFRLEPER